MQFDTKIAVVIRTDLEAWQKLNVAAFLAGGIAAAFPECIGEPYEDGSGTRYLPLIGQPILIYGADRPALTRALERALARNVKPAVYTEDMFKTTHDAANQVVRAVIRADLTHLNHLHFSNLCKPSPDLYLCQVKQRGATVAFSCCTARVSGLASRLHRLVAMTIRLSSRHPAWLQHIPPPKSITSRHC
jgi:hypothetical protein